MKVLHVITTIEMGGAEKQLLILCKEQVQLGLTVELIYLKGKPELKSKFEDVGVTINQSLVNVPFSGQILTLINQIRKITPDIVHAHLPRAELLVMLSNSRIPFVCSRHNSESFMPGAPKLVSIALSRIVSFRSSAMIFISQAVAGYMFQNHEISRSKKSKVILYGRDASNVQTLEAKDDICNFLNLRGKKIFGTIGRLTNQKDYPNLISAFKRVQVLEPNSVLLVIGEGELRSSLEQLVLDLGLEGKVLFLGRTDRIQEYLSVFDVFVLSSKYEGFGLVLLEAMQANVPIVAANNSAIPEVLGKTHVGLVNSGDSVGMAEKMVALLQSDLRNKVLKQQELRLPYFESRNNAESHLELYNSVLPKFSK